MHKIENQLKTFRRLKIILLLLLFF